MLYVLLLACSFGSNGPSPDVKSPKKADKVSTPASVRAVAGENKVTVPSETHKVQEPMLYWADHNVYPANNVVVLQGAAQGPLGDQEYAQFWLVGVHDYEVENGPSHLEAVMVYAVDCDDCPGEETTTAKIESRKSQPGKPASLMGVESMSVEDVDGDGQFEVVANARFRSCCEGDEDRRPYSETILLKVSGTEIVASAPLKKASKK
jgi:hypothetical protein